MNGYAWSSSCGYAGSCYAGYLFFSASRVHPLGWDYRAYGFPVRCVQHLHGLLLFQAIYPVDFAAVDRRFFGC